ncbi:hypothetical protein LTR62_003050 [Meristemomyces frigidus]|uniref:Redoxin domain-containing protein n=1 Tax=Meristemomyces frigidus TaxID=1508187 RepID=A0AAN7TJ30_9PEZI|nr:hypothetical protein LTR62_003050 [Meristemomyces frigidus]
MATPDWNTIPAPSDDGACDHLLHSSLPPNIPLPSTSGEAVDLASLPGLNIIFFYPRTASPDEIVPEQWNSIPGARGCTPQACSFRDAVAAGTLERWGVRRVVGCSVQGTAYQAELKGRVGLNYELVSDEGLRFAKAGRLPTMMWEGTELIRRCTLAVEGGKVVRVWYPVFPPDQSASEVVEWLKERA